MSKLKNRAYLGCERLEDRWNLSTVMLEPGPNATVSLLEQLEDTTYASGEVMVRFNGGGTGEEVFSCDLVVEEIPDLPASQKALAGQDFVAFTQRLSFTQDNDTFVVPITILKDQLAEGNEKFRVRLVNPSDNLNIPGPHSTLFVLIPGNDQHPPVIEVTGGTQQRTTNEGTTLTFAGAITDPDGEVVAATAYFSDTGESVPVTIAADGSFSFSHTYAQDSLPPGGSGPYTVTLSAQDGSGLDSSVEIPVLVNNVSPRVNPMPAINTVAGQPVNLTGSFTDPGADADFWLAEVYPGEGVQQVPLLVSPGAKTFSGSYTWMNPGQYLAVFTVYDDHGAHSRQVLVNVTAANVPPTLLVTRPGEIPEGSSVTLAGSFSDTDGPFIMTVNWGDGSPEETFSFADDGLFELPAHIYGQDDSHLGATYFATVTVMDAGELADEEVVPVHVFNVAPLFDLGPDVTIPVGGSFGATVGFTDPGADQGFWLPPGPAEITLAGSGPFATTGATTDQGLKTLTVAPFTFTQAGTYELTVGLLDDDTVTWDTVRITVFDPNTPPVVPGGHFEINEGDTLSFTGSFSDAFSESWTAQVNFGSLWQPLALNGDQTFDISRQYLQDGSFQILVRVTDNQGSVGEGTFDVLVHNVPPVPNAGPDVVLNPGETLTRTVTFTDPGADSPWLVEVFYPGDNQPVTFTTTEHEFEISRQFDIPGTYTVIVYVYDDHSARADQLVVTVNSPPAIEASGDEILEGGVATVEGAFFDPNFGPFTMTVNWGDQTTSTYTFLTGGEFSFDHLYEQDSSDKPEGVYSVVITVTDARGLSADATVPVKVHNVLEKPDVGPDVTIFEGETVSRLVTWVDPGDEGFWTVDVYFGEGSPETFTVTDRMVGIAHTFNDAGTYFVVVTVYDDDTARSSQFKVTVLEDEPPVDENAPPVVPGRTFYLNEGDTLDFTGYFTDGDSVSWAGAVTDDTGTQVLPLSGMTFSYSRLYPQDGTFQFTVEITDEHENTGTGVFTVIVANVAPIPDVGGNVTINLGETVNRHIPFTDPGADNPWQVELTVDGDTTSLVTESKEFDFSRVFNQEGTFVVYVTVHDDDTFTVRSFTVTVVKPVTPDVPDNPPDTPDKPKTPEKPDLPFIPPPWFFNPPKEMLFIPSVPWLEKTPVYFVQPYLPYYRQNLFRYDLYGSGCSDTPPEVYFDFENEEHRVVVIDEGDTLIHDGWVYDREHNQVGAMVNYGDGTGWQALPLRDLMHFTLNHLYEQDGEYEVWVRAWDSCGLEGYNVLRVIVRNVAPNVQLTGDRTVAAGQEASFSGQFTDPGRDHWTATVNWGDGSAEEAVELDGKSFRMQHRFTRAGSYRVRLTVNDGRDTGTGEFTITVEENVPAPAPRQGGGAPGALAVDDEILDAALADWLPEAEAGGHGWQAAAAGSAIALGMLLPLHERRRRPLDRDEDDEPVDQSALDEFFARLAGKR